MLFAPISFAIRRGEVSTRSWHCCSPLCYIIASAVSTTLLTRAHRQKGGRGTSKAQGSLCGCKNELDHPEDSWLITASPALTWNQNSLGFWGIVCPKWGAGAQSTADQSIGTVWTGIFRVNSRQPTQPARPFSGIPGKQQCKKKKTQNLNSLRRLQHFQSPCQGMGGTEQGVGCLPANARIPNGMSRNRGACQPWGARASPTHQPGKVSSCAAAPRSLSHSLAGPGAGLDPAVCPSSFQRCRTG